MDKFETLKRYKELADAGVLTQEEFEAKKKELLGAADDGFAIDAVVEPAAAPEEPTLTLTPEEPTVTLTSEEPTLTLTPEKPAAVVPPAAATPVTPAQPTPVQATPVHTTPAAQAAHVQAQPAAQAAPVQTTAVPQTGTVPPTTTAVPSAATMVPPAAQAAGKSATPFYKKWWFWLIIAVLLIGGAGAGMKSGGGTTTDNTSDTTVEQPQDTQTGGTDTTQDSTTNTSGVSDEFIVDFLNSNGDWSGTWKARDEGFFVFYPEGDLAEAFNIMTAYYSQNGELPAELNESFNSMLDSMKNLSVSVNDAAGRNCSLNIANPANTDKILLSFSNGQVVYNAYE